MGKVRMNVEIFGILPSEIIINILSKLSVRSVINCKRVCKSWLELIETREFANSHLSNSVPGIAMSVFDSNMRPSNWCGIIDIQNHNFQLNAIINLQFPNFPNNNLLIKGSADGLLLLHKDGYGYGRSLYLCNPVTREYIDLCSQDLFNLYSGVIVYGFGKSKIRGKYKVVMLPKSECKVYTIGTGVWRSIECDALLNYDFNNNGAFVNGNLHWLNYECSNNGAFVNGNLHWLASDLKGSPRISCFDLETELFTNFSVPLSNRRTSNKRLTAVEDRLSLCFNTEDEIVIWCMNEYGVEKSWTKKFSMSTTIWYGPRGVVHFEVFKNGDIFLSYDNFIAILLYYSSKNKTFLEIEMSQGRRYLTPAVHISSFQSLKSFVIENTISY